MNYFYFLAVHIDKLASVIFIKILLTSMLLARTPTFSFFLEKVTIVQTGSIVITGQLFLSVRMFPAGVEYSGLW